MIRWERSQAVGCTVLALIALTAISGHAQAPTLTVSPGTPSVGQTVTFTVTGRPGQNAVIAFSRFSGGAGRFRGQDILLGSDLAGLTGGTIGSDGRFTFSVSVPAGLSGLFHFQAAVSDDVGLTTNVVVTNGEVISLGGKHPVNNQAIKTIPVGIRPTASSAIPSQAPNFIHVLNIGSNSVSVIDNTTDVVATTIPVPATIGGADAAGGKIFVSLSGTSLAPDNRVVVIDPTTNTIVSTLTVGSRPVDVEGNFDGREAHTANSGDGTVSIIDTSGLTVSTIPVGGTPNGVNGFTVPNRIYAASADGNVFVVDTTTNQRVATIRVGRDPQFPLGTRSLNRIYVSNASDGTVSVIDTKTNSVAATITVGGSPGTARVVEVLKKVYAPDNATGATRIFVIDATTNTVVKTLTVGRGFKLSRPSPDGFRLFVTNRTDNTVSVIDTITDTVTATVPVGRGPRGIRFTRDGLKAYIMNQDDGTVSVIN